MTIFKTTTKGMVVKDGKIFMVKDQRGNWEFPGGRLGEGEEPEDALRREFIEELGVSDLTISKLIHGFEFESERDGQNYHYDVRCYQCDASLEDVKISDEHQECKWISLSKVDDFQMRDGYREAIAKLQYKMDKQK